MLSRKVAMLLGIFIIGVMAMAVPSAAAEGPTGLTVNGNRVFSNGPLTGVLDGTVPHLTFYATNDIGRTVYQLNFRALIEFSVTNSGDGTYESPEVAGRADFDSARWTPSSFYQIKDQNGVVIGMAFNFTLDSQLQVQETTPPPASLNPG